MCVCVCVCVRAYFFCPCLVGLPAGNFLPMGQRALGVIDERSRSWEGKISGRLEVGLRLARARRGLPLCRIHVSHICERGLGHVPQRHLGLSIYAYVTPLECRGRYYTTALSRQVPHSKACTVARILRYIKRLGVGKGHTYLSLIAVCGTWRDVSHVRPLLCASVFFSL